ncbi:hypothetical protein ALC56_00900 [Trachymyrmex septentrionalis]|uniref:Uncharacterized protein n=1 Tax=Trachymyrmex septentrionalis TaxID=34720 RepID=A0A195FYJ5_9HYME|nr:hypothetical protein ALC56_00900 [Trachymyrmex septentrionalis]
MIVTQLHSSLSHSMPCTTYSTIVIQSCRISIPKTSSSKQHFTPSAVFALLSMYRVWCLLANCRPSSVLTSLFDRSILLPTTILMISVLLQYVFNSLSHVSNFTKPGFPYIGFAYHKNFQYRQIIFLHNNLLITADHYTYDIKSIYQLINVNTENKYQYLSFFLRNVTKLSLKCDGEPNNVANSMRATSTNFD